ncbi:hypothetical protein DIPPA_34630 [Diplonema papillatum]|nr:hypothetical protein DIPPA_34630 [Diplonema papillatum]
MPGKKRKAEVKSEEESASGSGSEEETQNAPQRARKGRPLNKPRYLYYKKVEKDVIEAAAQHFRIDAKELPPRFAEQAANRQWEFLTRSEKEEYE